MPVGHPLQGHAGPQQGLLAPLAGDELETDGQPLLLRGVDPNKDQSYFLYMLHREQLAKAVFPVGGMTKAEASRRVRASK